MEKYMGNFLTNIFTLFINLSYYSTFLGTEPVLQVADNELVKEILVKEFNKFNDRRDLKTYHEVINQNLFNSRGEQWKRIRTITSSTFTSGKMKRLYGLVRKCLSAHLQHMEQLAEHKSTVEVKKLHENLTMDVIASCAFATNTNAGRDPDNEFLKNFRRMIDIIPIRAIAGFLFPKWLNNLIGLRILADPVATEWILTMLKHIIDKRRVSAEKNNDFLQLLIDAKADDKRADDMDSGLQSLYIVHGDYLYLKLYLI